MNKNDIAVIGAGISGLSVAHQLNKNGIAVHLFDKNDKVGGVIKTDTENGWRYEYGPNTLLLKDPEVEDLINEIGLSGQIEIANSEASKRFIVKEAELVSLPQSLTEFLKTSLFSATAKLRLLGEPFIGKSDPDATLAEFVENRFGREVLDFAVNPFVAGIYAGRPDNLSARHSFPALQSLEQVYGSIITGAVRKKFSGNGSKRIIKRRLISFTNGLQQLPEKMASHIENIYLNHEVKKLQKTKEGWIVKTHSDNFGPYRDVVFTLPLHKCSKSMLPLKPGQFQTLSDVRYPPMSSFVLGFKKESIVHPLDGFGFLVPEKENRSILGALFNSTLFTRRAPSGHHLLTVFIGGARQPELASLESDELLTLALHDLKELIGCSDKPVFKKHIYWPNSIPQYEPGYESVLATFDQVENLNPGLHFTGNYRQGISVPDCIKNGMKLGDKLMRFY